MLGVIAVVIGVIGIGTGHAWAQSSPPIDTAVLVRDIATSSYPSPDPAGITYIDQFDRLLISDSEVNEIPSLYQANLFGIYRDGSGLSAADTLGFSNEPTGLAYDPVTRLLLVSDDDRDEIYLVDFGPDCQYGTGDDIVTSFDSRVFGSADPEGIAFDPVRNVIYIADGITSMVYSVGTGPDGQFGTADDEINSFDTVPLGVADPEGIAYDLDNDLLYIAGEPKDRIAHVTTDGGLLVRLVDISAASAYNPSGLTLAPGSEDPSVLSLYVVDRAVDNDIDPSENDGRLYELAIPALPDGNLAPQVDAGPDRMVILPGDALLEASASDDGLPDPPGELSYTWTQQSGPGTASFADPTELTTTVSFSAPGSYTLRLLADDGQLSAFDEVAIAVMDAGSSAELIYLSTEFDGNVGGLAFADEDIIVYDTETGVWSMYFDGSDVGLGETRQELDAFHIETDGSILLSVRYETQLPDLGAVDDSDIVRFVPSSTGGSTAGSYQWYLDASDVELEGSGEDTNLIAFTPSGELLISANGTIQTSTVLARDEDLLLFTPTSLGEDTSGVWSLYFDGSALGLDDDSEDLVAASVGADGEIRFATRGAFSVSGVAGGSGEVVECEPAGSVPVTDCDFSLYWSGAGNGFGGTINGLSIVPK